MKGSLTWWWGPYRHLFVMVFRLPCVCVCVCEVDGWWRGLWGFSPAECSPLCLKTPFVYLSSSPICSCSTPPSFYSVFPSVVLHPSFSSIFCSFVNYLYDTDGAALSLVLQFCSTVDGPPDWFSVNYSSVIDFSKALRRSWNTRLPCSHTAVTPRFFQNKSTYTKACAVNVESKPEVSCFILCPGTFSVLWEVFLSLCRTQKGNKLA